VDFFLYALLPLLLLLLPLSLGVQGTFHFDKRVLFLVIRLYGVRIVFLTVYLSDQGVLISLNGKKGRPFTLAAEKPRRITFDPLVALRIRSLDLVLTVKGEPLTLSSALGATMTTISVFLSYLESRGILERASLRVMPRYSGGPSAVNFSIKILTSAAMLIGGLSHTTRGEKE